MLPLQPNLCVQWTSPVLLSLLCVECPLMSCQASWGQYSGPRRGNTLSSPGQACEGFYRCWECWQKSCVPASTTQRCLSCVTEVESSLQPGNNRASHLASPTGLSPLTSLFCPSCMRTCTQCWNRAVSKCKTDILMTWKRGCSLSPPYSLSKLVTAPMRSHFHVSLCFLFMKYHSGFLSVDSRFLEALCLHFKGTQR